MSDYADAGIPHYWLVSFDKVGAVTIERYALAGGAGPYVHVGTSHRDMGPVAVKVSAPFPVEIFWADLEVAPRVLPYGRSAQIVEEQEKALARLLIPAVRQWAHDQLAVEDLPPLARSALLRVKTGVMRLSRNKLA